MPKKTSRAPARGASPVDPETAKRPRRTLLSWCLIAAPLAFLAGHLAVYPLFLDPRIPGLASAIRLTRAGAGPFSASKRAVSVADLLVRRAVPAGAYQGYRIYLTLDDLADPRSFAGRQGSGNALAISHFVDPEIGDSATGALGRAVLGRLLEVSPDDRGALWAILQGMQRHAPGDVVDLALHVPQRLWARFPFDLLFVVALDQDVSDETLDRALANLFRKVEQRQVSRLVLPCLGYRWNQPRPDFANWFGRVFAAVRPTAQPREIDLSLYPRWPTFALEQAVSALNAAPPAEWDPGGEARLPYRKDLRLGLLLGTLCLYVCSFRVPITWKNFVLIALGCGGLFAGSLGPLEALTRGLDDGRRFGIQALVWLVIAVFFPIFARWNPAKLFEEA